MAPVVRSPVTDHFPPACQQQPGCKVAAHAYPQGPGRRAFWGWGETGRQGFQHQRNQTPYVSQHAGRVRLLKMPPGRHVLSRRRGEGEGTGRKVVEGGEDRVGETEGQTG